ncbi:MAG: glycosyltransferase family 2 protein [Clostridium sp.]
MDLVSLVIINYNNKSYLDRCLKSIERQTYKNLEVIFIDNESRDGSFDFMKEEYSEKNILLIKNEMNNGYAGAANQGIRLSKGKYVMILNPDIIMEKDFIEKLYNFMEKDSLIGALSGKLLKYDFENDRKLNYIDSAGIIKTSDYTWCDRGQNEIDKGQYDKAEKVFGVCGAAPFYRRSILEEIKVFDEYFDEDFFAYKEDIDLSWRINLVGFKNMYYPDAIAYHGRGMNSAKGVIATIKNRRGQSEFLKELSFVNHISMIKKNSMAREDSDKAIKKIKFKYYLYFSLFDQKCLKSRKKLKNLESKMEKKNRYIKENLLCKGRSK